jgi:hypothetical protein
MVRVSAIGFCPFDKSLCAALGALAQKANCNLALRG